MQNQQQIPGNQPRFVYITAKEFGAKFRSKPEAYRFMTGEVKAYLCHVDNVTLWHMRDLASGAKRLIFSEDVKYIAIPSFDGLTIPEFL